MSDNIEKTAPFKQLYVTATNLLIRFETAADALFFDEQSIEQVISNIDQLIAMLPLGVPVLDIHLENGSISILHEETVLLTLEDWKFRVLNRVLALFNDPVISAKYKPLVKAQAEKCIPYYPDKSYWEWTEWEGAWL